VELKDLLIGSIFKNDDKIQQSWLDLQIKFLSATTKEYDHFVVLMNGLTSSFFPERTMVIEPSDKSAEYSYAHLHGLNICLKEFKRKKIEYRNFLILDGDAFPIKKYWYYDLLKEMDPPDFFDSFGAAVPLMNNNKTYDIAIALRCENLEKRLHSSILFIRGQFLDNISFAIGEIGSDLIGNTERDIHIPFYEFTSRNKAFPLIRTNRYNIHPLLCGIYFNMFYHHACGSGRNFNLRATDYWDNTVSNIREVEGLMDQLFQNPVEFVKQLAGWSLEKYPVGIQGDYGDEKANKRNYGIEGNQ
jgi:hypothetical protein